MTSRDFCYWLQGFFEITKAGVTRLPPIDATQAVMIETHLALVFKHEIDPSMGGEAHQKELNEIHSKVNEALAKTDEAKKESTTAKNIASLPRDPMIRC